MPNNYQSEAVFYTAKIAATELKYAVTRSGICRVRLTYNEVSRFALPSAALPSQTACGSYNRKQYFGVKSFILNGKGTMKL